MTLIEIPCELHKETKRIDGAIAAVEKLMEAQREQPGLLAVVPANQTNNPQ